MPADEHASGQHLARERTLAIVIPALDEEAAVGAQVRALRAHPAFRALPLARMRIIVVDNGSRDRTAEVARAAGAEVVREPRRGYGYACLAGVRAATGAEVVLLMDGDGSDDLDGAARVARLVLAGEADLAMGARTLDRHRDVRSMLDPHNRRRSLRWTPALRIQLTPAATGRLRRGVRWTPAALTPQQRAGNAVGALALRLVYGARVSDIAPVRAIRREALLALDPHEMAYGWSTEMLAKAARAGLRIVELPVAAHPRAGGRSKVAGTLRGTIGASVHILCTLWRYRSWQPAATPAGAIAPGGPAREGPADESAPRGRRPPSSPARAGDRAARAIQSPADPVWERYGADGDTGRSGADWEQRGRWDSPAREVPSSQDRRALFVVARLPLAGQTKTRLGRVIGHEAAAELYRAFLRDLSARLRAAAAVDDFDLFWYYAAPEGTGEADFAACVTDEVEAPSASASSASSASSAVNLSGPPSPTVAARQVSPLGLGGTVSPCFLRQPAGDFAARLWHGFAALAARGYTRIVVLGSDSPQVPAAQIAAAFAALETHDVALGPARDGGYYLLGQRAGQHGRPADLFTGIPMSTSRVAAETRARAAALGLSVATLPESFDVDEPADLDMLARALADAPSTEADPALATLAALAPILAARIARATLDSAAPMAPRAGAAHTPMQPAGAPSVEGAAHGVA